MDLLPPHMRLIAAQREYDSEWRRISEQVTRGAHCIVCGIDKNLHAHHVLPRAFGGTDDIANLVPVCQEHHPTVERHTRTALGRAALTSRPRRAGIAAMAARRRRGRELLRSGERSGGGALGSAL
jgi:5-methylcytosine-specific restriction endonuclease McrA